MQVALGSLIMAYLGGGADTVCRRVSSICTVICILGFCSICIMEIGILGQTSSNTERYDKILDY